MAQMLQELGVGGEGHIDSVLEIGAGTGFLTGHLASMLPEAKLYINDIASEAEKYVAKYVSAHDHDYLWGDAEQLAFPAGVGLIASSSTVQWFDDIAAFAGKAYGASSDGGWLALSTFGAENFKEIRATTGEGLDYLPLPELEAILTRQGYRIVHSEQYTETLRFATPTDVLHHIKATGVNSIRKTRWNKRELADFCTNYTARFSTPDGSVELTYHPIIIIARKY